MSDQPPISIAESLDRYERAFGRHHREIVERGIQAIWEQRERERQERLKQSGKKRGGGFRSLDQENERFVAEQRRLLEQAERRRHAPIAPKRLLGGPLRKIPQRPPEAPEISPRDVPH